MNIHFFNTQNSKVEFSFEVVSLHPNILMADEVMYDSMTSELILVYQGLPTYNEDILIRLLEDLSGDEESSQTVVKSLRENQILVRKMQQLKHKEKKALIFIGNHKTIINNLRNTLLLQIKDVLDYQCLSEFMPFIEQKILNLKYSNFYTKKNLEDPFIRGISETIIQRQAMLCLSETVDAVFTSTSLNDESENQFDFIKIPMWNFPPIRDLTYAQIKYTRDNLKPIFADFKTQVQELSEQLFPLTFSPENHQRIKQLCAEKLNHHSQTIEHAINEHIYISKLKNQFAQNFGTRLYIGITSVENVINYYEKAEIVPDYVANEIKQQASRHIDLKATFMFTYYVVHGVNSSEKQSE